MVTNVYMTGVGGQGIGVLAEVIIQACLAAGHTVRGVDTHGLAQRGGVVVSHLRLGARALTPRIPAGQADIVIALERLEALRGVVELLKPGGTVVYYDTEMQPIHVRMGEFTYPTVADVDSAVELKRGHCERVYLDALPDPRMQNTAVLGRLAALKLIKGVDCAVMEQALGELLKPAALADNLDVFSRAQAAVASPH